MISLAPQDFPLPLEAMATGSKNTAIKPIITIMPILLRLTVNIGVQLPLHLEPTQHKQCGLPGQGQETTEGCLPSVWT